MNNTTSGNSGSSNPWAAKREEYQNKGKFTGESKFITPSKWKHEECHLLGFSKFTPCQKEIHGKMRDSAEIIVCSYDGATVEKVFNPYGRQFEAVLPILEEYHDTQSVVVKLTKFEGSTPQETTYTASVHGAAND